MKPISRFRIRARSDRSRLSTGRPFSSYRPSDGESSKPRIARSVDFPQPEGPAIETNSPRSMSRWIPARAWVSTSWVLKTLLRFSRWMRAGMVSLRFPDENVSVERLELELRPAAIEGAIHGMVHVHAILAAIGTAVFNDGLLPGGVHANVEVAEDLAIVGFQFHPRLGVCRQRHVHVAVEGAE